MKNRRHWAGRKIYNFNFQLKRLLLSGILFGATSSLFGTGSISIDEEWSSETEWKWSATVPAPQVQSITESGNTFSRIQVIGLENESRLECPSIPVFEKILNATPNEIRFSLQSERPRIVNLSDPIEIFRDIMLSGETNSSRTNETKLHEWKGVFPVNLVSVSFLGYQNGMPLSRLRIYPYQVQSDGKSVKYFERLVVSVRILDSNEYTTVRSSKSDPLMKSLGIDSPTIRKKAGEPLAKITSNPLKDRPLMRIVIDTDGIYRISKECLTVSGASIKGIDPRTFQLFQGGVEVPIYISGESDGVFNATDYIEFFGKRNRNSVADYEFDPFTDKNVYFLTWGKTNGLRYAEESAKPTVKSGQAIVPTDYLYQKHVETDTYFDHLGQVDVNQPSCLRDHWFFDSGINGGTTKDYTFTLSYPNTNTTKNFDIEVGLHGLTYQQATHTVQIYLNNVQAASGSWMDQQPYVVQNDPAQVLQNRFLKNGNNVLQIAVEGKDPTNKFDKILLNWFNVYYHRLYKADNDNLDFYRPSGFPNGLYQFSLHNFSHPDISVYKVGQSKLMNFEVDYDQGTDSYTAYLEDNVYSNSTLYWAAGRNGMKRPVLVQPDTIFGLSSNRNGANLIIIVAHRWKYSLEKLTDFYQQIGIQAKVVSIQDIYNEWNNGTTSPYALKYFLTDAYRNWNPTPEYVLLIGDTDEKNSDLLPCYFYQTYKYGASASDYWFSLIDGDDEIPDIAVGRWPCSTEDELKTLIQKRIDYEIDSKVDSWKNDILLIAGLGLVFENQSENMIKRQIRKEFGVERIYIDPASEGTAFFGGSSRLINLFNKGVALTNFMGHGGGAVWADRSLFNATHIDSLDNLKNLPFLTSMTCFTGDFTTTTGLGEKMVLAKNGGAIGLWGSSSVGWIKNDYLLDKPFYDAIFSPGLSVGKAILSAKTRYVAEMDYFDYLKSSLVYAYNLIGDPTVQIPFPQETVELMIDKENPKPGDKIVISGTLPFTSGEIYFQLYDSSKYKILSEPLTTSFSNGSISYSIQLPETISPGNAFLSYYVRNAQKDSDGHGATSFSISGLAFYGMEVQPKLPRSNEDIRIQIGVDIPNIQSLTCEIDTTNASEYLDENGIEHVLSFQNSDEILSVSMMPVASSSTQWQTTAPIRIGKPDKLIACRFISNDATGQRVTSPVFTFQIRREPDIFPANIDQSAGRFPELLVSIQNNGDDTLKTTIRTNRILPTGTEFSLDDMTTTLLPNRINQVHFPCYLGNRVSIFKISVDPANEIRESNESNNTLVDSFSVKNFAILPGLGTSLEGIRTDTISVNDIFTLSVASTAVQDTQSLWMDTDTTLSVINQPDFDLVSASSEHSRFGLNVRLINSDSTIRAFIGITPNRSIDLQDQTLSLGRWDPHLKIWIKEESTVRNGTIYSTSLIPGKFSLIRCSDSRPPHVELNIEGQRFFQNSYVSKKPNISIIGEDDNGIQFIRDGLFVKLDGNTVPYDDLSVPDSLINGNYVSAQFRPTLTMGEHTLEVTLYDAAKNVATETVSFIVSDELKIFDYGNYPNPFKDRTTFIYELTQPVKTLKINIYSPSGRLIKVLEEATVFSSGSEMSEGGYHEVTWDGLDSDGNFVANGVYFYQIVAKTSKKTVKSTGKIAKTR